MESPCLDISDGAGNVDGTHSAVSESICLNHPQTLWQRDAVDVKLDERPLSDFLHAFFDDKGVDVIYIRIPRCRGSLSVIRHNAVLAFRYTDGEGVEIVVVHSKRASCAATNPCFGPFVLLSPRKFSHRQQG